jgi:hypothetical protein
MDFEILGTDNKTYPADLATAQAWVKEGRIARTTQVYRTSRGDWIMAGEIEDIFPRGSDGDAPPVIAGPGAPPIISDAAAQAERKSNGLKLALAFGLSGIFMTLIPPLSFLGVAAMIGGFVLFLVWIVRHQM